MTTEFTNESLGKGEAIVINSLSDYIVAINNVAKGTELYKHPSITIATNASIDNKAFSIVVIHSYWVLYLHEPRMLLYQI